jgi:hypothetical protein
MSILEASVDGRTYVASSATQIKLACMRSVIAAAICATSPAVAQDAQPRFDIGIRGVVLLGKGEPANDMMGEGVVARFRVRDAWHLGFAYDSVTFDYETPNKALDIVSATVVDGSNDLSRASIFVERRYESAQRKWDWHWLAGLGFASVDAPNVTGLRANGDAFDIVTEADDEVHVFVGGGLRRPLGERWALVTTFTIEHHSTDYQLVDRVSGASASIDSQSPYGITIGVSYGF